MEIELTLDGCVRVVHEFQWPPEVVAVVEDLMRRVDALEDAMSSEQTDIDALTASISASVAAINQHISDLEGQISSGAQPDLTALKAEVATLSAIVPPAPAPPAPGTPPAPATPAPGA